MKQKGSKTEIQEILQCCVISSFQVDPEHCVNFLKFLRSLKLQYFQETPGVGWVCSVCFK